MWVHCSILTVVPEADRRSRKQHQTHTTHVRDPYIATRDHILASRPMASRVAARMSSDVQPVASQPRDHTPQTACTAPRLRPPAPQHPPQYRAPMVAPTQGDADRPRGRVQPQSSAAPTPRGRGGGPGRRSGRGPSARTRRRPRARARGSRRTHYGGGRV